MNDENVFYKQSELTGKEKVAYLFASLGVNNTKGLEKYFSTSQLKEIRKSLKKLQHLSVQNEIKMLEEVNKMGVAKRISSPAPEILDKDSYAKAHESEVKKQKLHELAKNADAVANVLSVWLKED